MTENLNVPLVSIIIINYNGKSYLEKCLESIKKIKYDNLEIIVVDNNSTDGTMEFLVQNYPSIITLKLDKNYGFAKPNNVAAKIAKGDFLLFLNNDTEVTPNFLTELVQVLVGNDQIGICQSLLLKPNGEIDSSGDFIDTIGVVYNSKKPIDKIREISSARGASMIIRKELFLDLGGFDEQFFVSFEDVDLGWRTWIKGYKVVINPKSVVYHHGGKTHDSIKDEISFHGLKNQLSMKITNFEMKYSISSLLKFFIIFGIRELKILLDYKIKGKTAMTSTKYEDTIAAKPNINAILKALFWIISNSKYLRNKRKKIHGYRKISTRELQKMNVLSNTQR
jgi:GT2 family glycosyltransferase